MTQRMTDELADAMAQVVADTFSDGFLQIYSGTAGATPDDISGGTLLCEILLPAVAFAVASGGITAMDGQWFGTVSTAGTAAWGRFANRANDMHLVVTVSNLAGAGELKLNSLSLTEGGVVDVSTFAYTVPTGA